MAVWHTREKGRRIVSMHEQEWRDFCDSFNALTQALADAEARAERWKAEAIAGRVRGGHSGGTLNRWPLCPEAAGGPCDCDICKRGFALAAARIINDQSEPPANTQTQEAKP